jgi:group II intron reverse transcriptase/maturase
MDRAIGSFAAWQCDWTSSSGPDVLGCPGRGRIAETAVARAIEAPDRIAVPGPTGASLVRRVHVEQAVVLLDQRSWTLRGRTVPNERRRRPFGRTGHKSPATRCREVACTSRKGTGREKPVRQGVPAFEDKVLQRAVAMVLEAVYEQDFLDCSYGFRPGRSPHQAVRAVWKQAMDMGGCWVLEVDIEDFFGSLDKTKLREILSQRVRDGVLLRLIGKWLNAGVMEEGCLYHPETGVPQGGVISPILSNVYLHEVLDQWFEGQVKPRLKGRAFLTRFADDFVLTFEREEDALRVQAVLAKRFDKYGLRLHPTKTRLVRFYPPTSSNPQGGEGQRQRSFDLPGFTLYWGRSRKGRWVVQQKTMKSRLAPHLDVVQGEPTPAGQGAIRSLESEAQGALLLLRSDRELPGPAAAV